MSTYTVATAASFEPGAASRSSKASIRTLLDGSRAKNHPFRAPIKTLFAKPRRRAIDLRLGSKHWQTNKSHRKNLHRSDSKLEK
jgi:hypothetical protein